MKFHLFGEKLDIEIIKILTKFKSYGTNFEIDTVVDLPKDGKTKVFWKIINKEEMEAD